MKKLYLTPKDDVRNILNGLGEPTEVTLAKGIYNIKAEISADCVVLRGEEKCSTVITCDDYARKIHPDGKEYNTFRTYTLCITGNGVRLENLTVENSNTSPETVGQCVALSVHGDNFYANNVDLRSTQDTLFLSPFPDDLVVRYRDFLPPRQLYKQGNNRHLFENCRIYGTVDFIFGCAEAYFKNCEIVSVKDARGVGFVAAPAHSLKQERGFAFIGCRLRSEGVEQGKIFLARPWRDFGKCEFINCALDGHISPELFDKWNDTERDKFARFAYFGLDCKFTPVPVLWANKLTKEQADEIIARCDRYFNNIKV